MAQSPVAGTGVFARSFGPMSACRATLPPDVPSSKAGLRRIARAARVRMGGDCAARAAGDLARVGLAALARFLPEDGGAVTGYWPVRGEIDPLPLLRLLHAKGCSLALPALPQGGGDMEFRFWTPAVSMVSGAFDIPVPPRQGGVMEVPDVLLVPLLAFDRRLYRLGYGGGHYDRALARLRRGSPQTLAFGLAFAGQEMESLPREAHDQPLDGVLTPAGMIVGTERRA